MIEIRYVQSEDKEFWYSLDRHLPEQEFDNKVNNKRGYKDCGGFVIDVPGYEQPMEMFLLRGFSNFQFPVRRTTRYVE